MIRRLHRRCRRLSYDYRVWSDWLSTQALDDDWRGRPDGTGRPLISASLSVSASRPRHLRRAVASVLAQRYPHWTLHIRVDPTASSEVLAMVSDIARRDRRVTVALDHTPSTTSVSSADRAPETFHVWLHPDDTFAADAFGHVATTVRTHPDVQVLYGNEDSLGPWGRRTRPQFKSAWSPHRLRSYNFIGRPWFIRADLYSRLEVPATDRERCVDYGLLLQATEHVPPGAIQHIRRVLYHRGHDTHTRETDARQHHDVATRSRHAVVSHLQRCGIDATVESIPGWTGFNRITYAMPTKPLVSVIIPTRDKLPLLDRCVTGLLQRTNYPATEVIILDNGSREPATHAYLAALAGQPRVQVLRVDAPFNFSALCNRGARAASGHVLCFLNNDMEITTPQWLEELVGLAMQPEVGAVAPLLRYPDGRIQHLGIRVDPPWPRLIGDGWREPLTQRDAARMHAVHNVAAVTGGCLVTRRDVFVEVGGFDEALPVAHNDVDFCLSVRRAGRWVVVTPFTELSHELFVSRREMPKAARRRDWEDGLRYLADKWRDQWGRDPFEDDDGTR
jgi:GT2 family glycosyltransferase